MASLRLVLEEKMVKEKKLDFTRILWDDEIKKFLSDEGEIKTLKSVSEPQLFLSNIDWFEEKGFKKEKKLYERAKELNANAFSAAGLNLGVNYRARGYGHGRICYAVNFYKAAYKEVKPANCDL